VLSLFGDVGENELDTSKQKELQQFIRLPSHHINSTAEAGNFLSTEAVAVALLARRTAASAAAVQ
jgi:hypothetical protein